MVGVTAMEVYRESVLAEQPSVARVDAVLMLVQTALSQAREKLRAQTRNAARAMLAGGQPSDEVIKTREQIIILEAAELGCGDLRLLAMSEALEQLALEQDAIVADAERQIGEANARFAALRRGEPLDIADAEKLDRTVRTRAEWNAEQAARGAGTRARYATDEARRLRNERESLKRTHAALFAAEGIR